MRQCCPSARLVSRHCGVAINELMLAQTHKVAELSAKLARAAQMRPKILHCKVHPKARQLFSNATSSLIFCNKRERASLGSRTLMAPSTTASSASRDCCCCFSHFFRRTWDLAILCTFQKMHLLPCFAQLGAPARQHQCQHSHDLSRLLRVTVLRGPACERGCA